MTTKKAIILGFLTTGVITLLAFGIKNKSFKITTPNANKRIEVKAENTITDLTNTKWYFNETLINKTPLGTETTYKPLTNQNEGYNIYFTSRDTSYTAMMFTLYASSTHNALRYISRPITTAYDLESNIWTYQNYRLIHITGGTDVQNTNLINWLKINATQLTIEDLTNTSWKLNYELNNIPASYRIIDIEFYNNGQLFDEIALGYLGANSQANCICYGASRYVVYQNAEWQGEWSYRQASRLYITGGQDSTDINVIIWLLQNATQYQNIETLEKTKWQFVENPMPRLFNYTFNINFTSNKKSCNGLKAGTTNNILAYSYKTDSEQTPYAYYQIYNGYQWSNTNYQTIIILSGDDIENLSLINFLTCNAEWTSYQPIPNNADQYDIENGNFVSLQGLMIQILTMPFTFISQAFNVTLWPNTAWEFNLSNFILSIIAIASLIFIIRLFTSGFAVIGNYTGRRDDRAFKRSQTKLNNSKADLNNRTDPNNKHITTKKE